MNLPSILRRTLALLALALPLLATAQEATIRKTLTDRIPGLASIDEISKTPMPGLFEVRIGNDIFYTDPEGNYLIQGALIDTRARKNLTEERIDKLTAVDFKELQLKNAVTVVRGNGKRKLAVFADPNCPYCKRFEKDLEKIDNVTVHTFLIPILGADSTEKSKRIWCASDKVKSWDDWMLRNVAPKEAGAKCNTDALDANVAFARKYNITGTPTLVFTDGHRVPGAINTQQIEQLLAR